MLDDLNRAKIVITSHHAFKLLERIELSKGGRLLLQGRGGDVLNTLELKVKCSLNGDVELLRTSFHTQFEHSFDFPQLLRPRSFDGEKNLPSGCA